MHDVTLAVANTMTATTSTLTIIFLVLLPLQPHMQQQQQALPDGHAPVLATAGFLLVFLNTILFSFIGCFSVCSLI